MELTKNFRFLILLALLIASAFFLGFQLLAGKEGVRVTLLSPESRCNNIEEGFIITEVAGKKIASLDDFESEVGKVKGGDYLPMKADGIPAGCFAIADGDAGIRVEEIEKGRLRFSNEIADAEVEKFELENLTKERVEKAYEILKIRAGKLKLFVTEIGLSDNLIEIVNPEKLDELFATCKLEIKISHPFDVRNGSSTIGIGDNFYELRFSDEGFEIDSSFYSYNQSFHLEGIELSLANITNTSAVFHATLASNRDIIAPHPRLSSITPYPATGNYLLNFPVEISAEAENRTKNILKNIGAYTVPGQARRQVLLKADFLYFLDGKLISSFPIPREFRVKADIIPIVALRKSLADAAELKELLDSCLSSGILEQVPKKVSTETRKAKFTSLAQALVIAAIALPFLSAIKFKGKALYGLLPSFLSISKFITILGIAALTQLVFSPGWIIDLLTLFALLVMALSDLVEIFYGMRKIEIGKYVIWIAGLFLLFTPLRSFGLVVIFWAVFDISFAKPLLENFLKG